MDSPGFFMDGLGLGTLFSPRPSIIKGMMPSIPGFHGLLGSPLPPPYSDARTEKDKKACGNSASAVAVSADKLGDKLAPATPTATAKTGSDTPDSIASLSDAEDSDEHERPLSKPRSRSISPRGHYRRPMTQHAHSHSCDCDSWDWHSHGRYPGEPRDSRDARAARSSSQSRSPSPSPVSAPLRARTNTNMQLRTPSRTPSPPASRFPALPSPRDSPCTPCTPCTPCAPSDSHSHYHSHSRTHSYSHSHSTSHSHSLSHLSHSHPNSQALMYPATYPNSSSSPPPKYSPLTLLLLSWVNRYVVPYLPDDLAAIARNPPDLSRPETLVVLFRAIAPYTQFLLIIVVLYVVWAVVSGFIAYSYRFLRFCFRIGPVIAIIAWIMAASGQGGIDVIFEALKQYAGLAPADDGYIRGQPPRRAPGWHTPGAGSSYRRRPSDSDSSSYYDPRSRTNSHSKRNSKNKQPQQPDPLASLLEDGLGATVQGYVRAAVARAAGLDWLMAPPQQKDDKDSKKRDSRYGTR